MANGPYLRKYGVQTTINFVLYEVDGVDFRVDAADGGTDCSVMKDEGEEATATNDFVDEGMGYSLVLTATEMQAARIVVYVIDSATKVWLDESITIETYGNASAMHAMDLDDAVRGGLTALPNAAADAAGGLPISDAGGLDMDTKLANTNEVTAARMEALTDWIDGGRLDLLLDAIPTTAMRGTDNGALASVLGALADAAADGDPTTADTLMKYIKQLINILIGTAGIVAFPAEAAPANAVSLAEVIRAIHVDVTGLNGDAMRGTNNGALASVATEGRLAELDAGNIPADIDALPSAADVNAQVDAALVDAGVVLQVTTIATLASQTSFTLTAGSADDDAYNNCLIIVTDASTATQKAVGFIRDYTGASKTVTLAGDPGVFTMATTDKIAILSGVDKLVESTLTEHQILRLAVSALAGLTNTNGTVFRDIGDTKARITATLDANKNRTGMVLDGTL